MYVRQRESGARRSRSAIGVVGSVDPTSTTSRAPASAPSRGCSPTLTDSCAVARATIGYALEHTLWRLQGRGNWLPATRALLDIGVISLWRLTIIPERGCRRRQARSLGSGLDIDLRRGCDNNRWVGIWLPIVGTPIR